jgi:hypothetical protein
MIIGSVVPWIVVRWRDTAAAIYLVARKQAELYELEFVSSIFLLAESNDGHGR